MTLGITVFHGTWTRAEWVRPGSAFRGAMEKELGQFIGFEEPLSWTLWSRTFLTVLCNQNLSQPAAH